MNTAVGTTKAGQARPMPARRLRARHAIWLGCAMLAALLVGPLAGAAQAAPEMSGEWQLTIHSGAQTVKGVAIISQEANAKGEFASSSMVLEGVDPGTFTGTLGTTEASARVTAQAFGPFPATEFSSSTMQIQEGAGSLSLSGSGTVTSGGSSSPGSLTATRVRTYKEVEEQQAIEQREREEAVERQNVRGEWTVVIQSGPQEVHGVARIAEAANAKNEFASKSALFEGAIPGSFTGKLEGSKATVEITTQAAGPYPASRFTSSSIVVTSSTSAMSMSGSGTVEAGGMSAPATLTATRTKSSSELAALEAQEAREREAKEKEAAEAQAKLEREAAAQQAGQTTQNTSGAGTSTSGADASSTPTLSVQLASRSVTVNGAGSLALALVNPNALAVTGRVTLVLLPASGKNVASRQAGHKPKAVVLGVRSFGLSPSGDARVSVRLGKQGSALLARHGKLRVVARVRTEGSAGQATVKSYLLTLRASHAKAHH